MADPTGGWWLDDLGSSHVIPPPANQVNEYRSPAPMVRTFRGAAGDPRFFRYVPPEQFSYPKA